MVHSPNLYYSIKICFVEILLELPDFFFKRNVIVKKWFECSTSKLNFEWTLMYIGKKWIFFLPDTSVVFWSSPRPFSARQVYFPNLELSTPGMVRVWRFPRWLIKKSADSWVSFSLSLNQVTVAFGEECTTQITSVWSPSPVWINVSSCSISGLSAI